MTNDWDDRVFAFRKMEDALGRERAVQDPYIKFLPFILYPLELPWDEVPVCAERSAQRFIIPAYGCDPIARAGWIRFATLAVWSLLHCRGIEQYGITVLKGDYIAGNWELGSLIPELFGDQFQRDQHELQQRGVQFANIAVEFSTGNLYGHIDPADGEVFIRVDADSGFLSDVLCTPFFELSRPLGESGLNYRHTGRSGFDQLFSSVGRMRLWPAECRTTSREFLAGAARVLASSLGIEMTANVLAMRLACRTWPSEGLSYIKAAHLPEYVRLQRDLRRANLVPERDEEIVKLILACANDWHIEVANVPVLEAYEYGSPVAESSVINFRNQWHLFDLVPSLLTDRELSTEKLGYLHRFVDQVRQQRR